MKKVYFLQTCDTCKRILKEDVEYDFYFDIENTVEDKPKKQSYCNPILDFRLAKRPSLY